jgi:hypothetical protein
MVYRDLASGCEHSCAALTLPGRLPVGYVTAFQSQAGHSVLILYICAPPPSPLTLRVRPRGSCLPL